MNKHKTISVFLICLLAVFIPAQAEDTVYGDLTGNNEVNVSDAIIVLRSVVGLVTLTTQQEAAADVNQDGDINVSDAIIILRYIVGLVDSLPVIDEPEPDPETGEMEIHFIDVGQGSSALIETPSEKYVLIDGGPRSAGDDLVAYLNALEVDILHKVIATHQHEDHIGGLVSVYESPIEVEVTYSSNYEHDTIVAGDFRDLADEHSEYKTAWANDTLNLNCNYTDMTFLHPYREAEGDIHYINLVLNVEYNEVSALITGDAEADAESAMIENLSGYLPSQILQVGHHGSRTSTSQAFLNAVSPEVAVIQVGEGNRYGHPHDEVLARLDNAGVDVYRNDLQGSIVVTTDGQDYTVDEDPVEVEPDRVNINTASLEELQRIHGIGPALAEGIIDKRPFSSLDELTRVSGIGDATVEGIKEQGLAYVE